MSPISQRDIDEHPEVAAARASRLSASASGGASGEPRTLSIRFGQDYELVMRARTAVFWGALSLVGIGGAGVYRSEADTKADAKLPARVEALESRTASTSQEVSSLRAEMRDEFKELKADLRSQITELRADVRQRRRGGDDR